MSNHSSIETVPALPSLGDIKAALSPECFAPDATLSLLYVTRAVLLSLGAGGLLWAARNYCADHAVMLVTLTLAYAWFQGLVFWGFFTIGHE